MIFPLLNENSGLPYIFCSLHSRKWILFRRWTDSEKCSQREFVSCPGQLKTNQNWACCFLQSKLVQTKTQTRSPTSKLESQEHFRSTHFPLCVCVWFFFFICYFSSLLCDGPSWSQMTNFRHGRGWQNHTTIRAYMSKSYSTHMQSAHLFPVT